MLGTSAVPLHEGYDLAMLDLDGVVYIGPDAVPGAADHLRVARAAGMGLAYVTNNASRPPDAVAAHLRRLGIPAEDADVVTSAQAAARVLRERLDEGARVFVIGGEGLEQALTERGLVPVTDLEPTPDAVVSGYHPDLPWRRVTAGALLVRRGLWWVASNTDLTVPTPDGPGPGNGVLVRVVAEFSGVEPVVAGKPEPPLFRETQARVGGERPLVVGDRLDTDIEGAVRAGYDSLLVLTGVTGLAELVEAPADRRPTYISADLSGLAGPHPAPKATADGWELGGWTARLSADRLRVEGSGAHDDWWRVVAVAAWSRFDEQGTPVSVTDLTVPPR